MIQIKVQLSHIKNPAIWRNLVVPTRVTFFELHHYIQIAFGLCNYHLFEFTKYGRFFTIDLEVFRSDEDTFSLVRPFPIDADKTLVLPYLKEYGNMDYSYDFGDGWEFKITLMKEGIKDNNTSPRVVGYRGENIPEDSGGVEGLLTIRAASKNPESEDYQSLLEWNPLIEQPFDLEEVNEELADFYKDLEDTILLVEQMDSDEFGYGPYLI